MDEFIAVCVLILCLFLPQKVLKDQLLTAIQFFVVIFIFRSEFDSKSTVVVFHVAIHSRTAAVAIAGRSGLTVASARQQTAVIPDIVDPVLQSRCLRYGFANLGQSL